MPDLYKITVEKLVPAEGDKYPKTEKVYEQTFEKVDVGELAIFLNSKKVEPTASNAGGAGH